MAETKFTAGPWASENGEDGTHTISSVDGTAVIAARKAELAAELAGMEGESQ